jgi:hypothetical protein
VVLEKGRQVEAFDELADDGGGTDLKGLVMQLAQQRSDGVVLAKIG